MSLLYPDWHSARHFFVSEDSGVGDARRSVAALAEARGLPDDVLGRLAIVTTELAGNLARHATHGGVLFCHLLIGRAGVDGAEVLSVDHGPGIASLTRAHEAGFSTIGGAGLGLNAVRHLSDEYDIDSEVGRGTVVIARVCRPGSRSRRVQLGGLCAPHPHEDVCGDGWGVRLDDAAITLLLSDGLGHGPGAAEASKAAAETLEAGEPRSPSSWLRALREPLQATRGAAVMICRLDLAQEMASFSGIGNVWGVVQTDHGAPHHLLSVGGIVGRATQEIRENHVSIEPRCVLVVCSDGIHQRWSLQDERPFFRRHPALAAGIIFRDYSRHNDDVSVLAVRVAPNERG